MASLNKMYLFFSLIVICTGCQDIEDRPPRQTSAEIRLVMESDDGNAAVRMRRLVAKTGGYIQSGELRGDRSAVPEAAYTFMIPIDRLDEFRAGLSKIALISQETQNVSDRTREVTRLQATLTRAQQERQRLDKVPNAPSSLAQLNKEQADWRERESAARDALDAVGDEVRFAAVGVELGPQSSALVREPLTALKNAGIAGYTAALNVLLGAFVVAAAVIPTLLLLAGGLLSLVALFRLGWRVFRFVSRPRALVHGNSNE